MVEIFGFFIFWVLIILFLYVGIFLFGGEDLLSRVGEYALGIGDFLAELEISLGV